MSSEKKYYDLGCGQFKLNGYIGIDNSTINPVNNVKFKPDILYDLNKGIPINDNSADGIYMGHFLEHVKNPYIMLDECYRVCKPDSEVEIKVPLLDILLPAHITCFYTDWFERNLDLSKWRIIKKESGLREVHDPSAAGARCFYELHVILKVIK